MFQHYSVSPINTNYIRNQSQTDSHINEYTSHKNPFGIKPSWINITISTESASPTFVLQHLETQCYSRWQKAAALAERGFQWMERRRAERSTEREPLLAHWLAVCLRSCDARLSQCSTVSGRRAGWGNGGNAPNILTDRPLMALEPRPDTNINTTVF